MGLRSGLRRLHRQAITGISPELIKGNRNTRNVRHLKQDDRRSTCPWKEMGLMGGRGRVGEVPTRERSLHFHQKHLTYKNK